MEKKQGQPTGRRKITFVCNAPDAGNVSLVGEFNGWDPEKHPMKGDGQGRWTRTVMLAPGVYEYKFWVDGQWIADHGNAQSRINGYGTFNSVLTVLPKPD